MVFSIKEKSLENQEEGYNLMTFRLEISITENTPTTKVGNALHQSQQKRGEITKSKTTKLIETEKQTFSQEKLRNIKSEVKDNELIKPVSHHQEKGVQEIVRRISSDNPLDPKKTDLLGNMVLKEPIKVIRIKPMIKSPVDGRNRKRVQVTIQT
ncbi:hypothetical protein ACB092_08G195300 [Castanea dentata]